jgi:hypothetical protein
MAWLLIIVMFELENLYNPCPMSQASYSSNHRHAVTSLGVQR